LGRECDARAEDATLSLTINPRPNPKPTHARKMFSIQQRCVKSAFTCVVGVRGQG